MKTAPDPISADDAMQKATILEERVEELEEQIDNANKILQFLYDDFKARQYEVEKRGREMKEMDEALNDD